MMEQNDCNFFFKVSGGCCLRWGMEKMEAMVHYTVSTLVAMQFINQVQGLCSRMLFNFAGKNEKYEITENRGEILL